MCRSLGVDLDGGNPRGLDGVIDGGRAAILESTRQFNADGSVTKRPLDHVTAAGDGAGFYGINSATLQLSWPNPRPKRWTEVTCFRELIPRTAVASLRKADGSPLDHNPIDSFSMDRHRTDRSGATTYWVRGGELLNVWIAR